MKLKIQKFIERFREAQADLKEKEKHTRPIYSAVFIALSGLFAIFMIVVFFLIDGAKWLAWSLVKTVDFFGNPETLFQRSMWILGLFVIVLFILIVVFWRLGYKGFYFLDSLCYGKYISPENYRIVKPDGLAKYLNYHERLGYSFAFVFLFTALIYIFLLKLEEIGINEAVAWFVGVFSLCISLLMHYDSVAEKRRKNHQEIYKEFYREKLHRRYFKVLRNRNRYVNRRKGR